MELIKIRMPTAGMPAGGNWSNSENWVKVWQKIWVFYLYSANEIVASMRADDAYKRIKWPGSYDDFLETWLFIQDAKYVSPQHPDGGFSRVYPHKQKSYDESYMKYE